jgi:hypothetical protein
VHRSAIAATGLPDGADHNNNNNSSNNNSNNSNNSNNRDHHGTASGETLWTRVAQLAREVHASIGAVRADMRALAAATENEHLARVRLAGVTGAQHSAYEAALLRDRCELGGVADAARCFTEAVTDAELREATEAHAPEIWRWFAKVAERLAGPGPTSSRAPPKKLSSRDASQPPEVEVTIADARAALCSAQVAAAAVRAAIADADAEYALREGEIDRVAARWAEAKRRAGPAAVERERAGPCAARARIIDATLPDDWRIDDRANTRASRAPGPNHAPRGNGHPGNDDDDDDDDDDDHHQQHQHGDPVRPQRLVATRHVCSGVHFSTPEPTALASEPSRSRPRVRAAYSAPAARGTRPAESEQRRFDALRARVANASAARADATWDGLEHALRQYQRTHGANVTAWGEP